MIRDLDATLSQLLKAQAAAGSILAAADTEISFDLPDERWRGRLNRLTVNCYLYDVRENTELRTHEPRVQRSPDGTRAARRRAPVRIDCAYCITAWSPATNEPIFEEHRLLSQVLDVLLRNPTIPSALLQGSLQDQIPPYPTVIASQDGIKDQPQFWGALNQQLKPSLNYVVTLALILDQPPAQLPPVVQDVVIDAMDLSELVGS